MPEAAAQASTGDASRIPAAPEQAYAVPFNRAAPVGNELDYVRTAIVEARISGDGPYTRAGERLLEELLGASRVLLVTSCTHAMELASTLLHLGPGDEVIVPSFTFPSTANAFTIHGVRPVFIDIRPDTLNLDAARLESLITSRTKAILAVHYAGVACDMEAIDAVAQAHGLAVVEDNAQGFLGEWRGRPLGTLGRFGALSFHETKNVTCGEGGALIVSDPRDIDRAEIVRSNGTNRAGFLRGEVPNYTWVDIGSNYVMSEILAAYLLGQLQARERIQQARKGIWERYAGALAPWASAGGIRLPVVPPGCVQPAHLFFVVLPDSESRDRFIGHMRAAGVLAVSHYEPLHLSRMGQRFGDARGTCPITESVSQRLARLPLYATMTTDEQSIVIDAALAFAA